MEATDDLTNLSYLHEAGVLNSVKQRYLQESIYTYSGLVLIAMNPFRRLDIYTPEIINGMSNFMAQNMRSILSQYFPNQTSYTSTSYDGSGINPPGGLPPIQAMGGNP